MTPEVRILKGQSQYDIFRNWQVALRNGFDRAGIRSFIVPIDRAYGPGSNGRAVTLGFNLVRHWSISNLQRPHFAWTVDHPNFQGNFFLAQTVRIPVNLDCCAMGCVDFKWAQFAREAYGFPHVYFFPHASVLLHAEEPDWTSRPFDAVFFGSMENAEDHAAALRRKVEILDAPMWPFVQKALEEFRYHIGQSLDRFLWNPMRASGCPDDISRRFLCAYYPGIDTIHRYRDRVWTFRSIRRHTVHVFGQGPWNRFDLPANIVLHDAVPYSEALEIMKQTRVLLNHAPTLTGGGHERVFDALLSGCFVASTGSEYLAAEFPDGEGVRFYSGAGPNLDDLLEFVLTDPASRDRVRAAQKTALLRHTMSSRAVELLALIEERWPDRFGPGNS